MIVDSMDPGKLALPVCRWQDTRLTHAFMSRVDLGPRASTSAIAAAHVQNICTVLRGQADAVYVEQLSLNKGRDGTLGKALATGNDLLELTGIAAIVAGALGRETRYLPVGVWKGSAKKEITRNRVRATLAPDELAILDAALAQLPRRGGRESSLAHNLYDSCGIGLCATGRYVVRRGYRT